MKIEKLDKVRQKSEKIWNKNGVFGNVSGSMRKLGYRGISDIPRATPRMA